LNATPGAPAYSRLKRDQAERLVHLIDLPAEILDGSHGKLHDLWQAADKSALGRIEGDPLVRNHLRLNDGALRSAAAHA